MGKWATYRRRGSTPPGEVTPALPSVVISVGEGPALQWPTYSGPLPDQWTIFQDGTVFDEVAGTEVSYPVAELGSDYAIQGQTSGGVPQTQMSNTVLVT